MSRILATSALLLVAAATLAAIVQQGTTTDRGLKSGLNKGDRLTPFNPRHVTGADRGTETCPV